MKAWPLCLAAALFVGTGLRIYRLDHSLRVDEIEAWARSQEPLSMILSDEIHQPHASVMSHWSCLALGDSEFPFRLPYALYGILSLPLIYLLGRRLFDERVGALACFLLALSAFHIQYSQEARYYAPLVFYCLSALYCMICALDPASLGGRRRRIAFWAGFALSHLLGLSLHPFALYPATLSAAFLFVVAMGNFWRRRDAAGAAFWVFAMTAGTVLLAWRWPGLRQFLRAELTPP